MGKMTSEQSRVVLCFTVVMTMAPLAASCPYAFVAAAASRTIIVAVSLDLSLYKLSSVTAATVDDDDRIDRGTAGCRPSHGLTGVCFL